MAALHFIPLAMTETPGRWPRQPTVIASAAKQSHESYSMALTVYKLYEAANAAGIPGAKQGYDKLKARFDAQGNGAGRKTDQPVA